MFALQRLGSSQEGHGCIQHHSRLCVLLQLWQGRIALPVKPLRSKLKTGDVNLKISPVSFYPRKCVYIEALQDDRKSYGRNKQTTGRASLQGQSAKSDFWPNQKLLMPVGVMRSGGNSSPPTTAEAGGEAQPPQPNLHLPSIHQEMEPATIPLSFH